MTAPFDFAPLLAPGTPAPAAKWNGFPKYNFVGGHNDADNVPVDALIEAATNGAAPRGSDAGDLRAEQRPARLPAACASSCRASSRAMPASSCSPDEILITSGSLQGLDLVNTLLLGKGDTVLIEKETYGGALTRLAKFGVNIIGIPLDSDGMRMDALKAKLEELKAKGVKPKYIYTIPTVQNPTGSIMPEARRKELIAHRPRIRRDDLRGRVLLRPGVERRRGRASIYSLAGGDGVIFVGSFSKSIAPALRVGYIVAKWDILARILGLKQDAGSGALEQMVLAEFCTKHFANHVPKLNKALSHKLQVLREALAEQFGTAAEFGDPPGGIYLWIKLPDNVDTVKLGQAALAAGVSLNPGPEWSTDKEYARSRLRLCFANPDPETIKKGVEVLAEVCRREFGVPLRSANIEKA